MVFDLSLIIGTAGMALILLGFVLNLFKKVEQAGVFYITVNIIGGALLTYYAYMIHSIPFFILNGVWVISAVWGFFISNSNSQK